MRIFEGFCCRTYQ